MNGRTLPWSVEQARADYVNSRLTTRQARRHMRVEVLSTIEPKGLQQIVGRIHRTSPDALRPFLDEVLVVNTASETEIVAYAQALGAQSRIIAISKRFSILQLVFGELVAEVITLFRQFAFEKARLREKEFLPPTEALVLMDQWGEEIASTVGENQRLLELRDLLASLTMKERRLRDVVTRLIQFRSRDADHIFYADAGLAFTVAHELSHHLLNHTRFGQKDVDAPGPQYLQNWLAGLDYELPAAVPALQREEQEADALALALLLGDQSAAAADVY